MIGKLELLEACAGKNRGLLATDTEKRAILAAIAQLEGLNPTPRPLEAGELLDGDWRLLYTTSKGILNIARLPLAKLGEVYQCIRVKDAKIYNIAEIYGLPLLESLVSVCARFQPVSERRVEVKFERNIAGLQRLIRYQSPAQFIQDIESGQKFRAIDADINPGDSPTGTLRSRQGWLDTTYLDSDLRIGRGNEGSVFVLIKR